LAHILRESLIYLLFVQNHRILCKQTIAMGKYILRIPVTFIPDTFLPCEYLTRYAEDEFQP
jgi:hypothetical protein